MLGACDGCGAVTGDARSPPSAWYWYCGIYEARALRQRFLLAKHHRDGAAKRR